MAKFQVEIPDEGLKALELTPSEFVQALKDTLSHISVEGAELYLAGVQVTQQELATPEEISEAQEIHGCEEVEIDEGAAASRADRNDGLWVQAWVWLSRQNAIEIIDDGPCITVRQYEENVESFMYDNPGEREETVRLARECAEELSNGDYFIYDDTLEVEAAAA